MAKPIPASAVTPAPQIVCSFSMTFPMMQLKIDTIKMKAANTAIQEVSCLLSSTQV